MVIFYVSLKQVYIEGPTTNIDLNYANGYRTFVYIQLSIDRTKGRKVKNSIALTRFLTLTKIKKNLIEFLYNTSYFLLITTNIVSLKTTQ